MANKWGARDDYAVGVEFSPNDWNHEVRSAATQAMGAFQGIGPGVITGLVVSRTGNSTLAVSAGKAINESSAFGLVYLETLDASALDLSDDTAFPDVDIDGDNYVFASVVAADVVDTPDSRESGYIVFVVQPDDTCDGGTLLAKITMVAGVIGATVVDQRTKTYIGTLQDDLDAAVARVVELEAVVGYPYNLDTKGTLDARILALMGGGGGDPAAVITYLQQLKYSESDPRNAITVIEEKIASLRTELLAVIATGGVRPQQTDVDQIVHELALVRQSAGKLNPQDLERSQSANVLATVDGIYGDGTNSFPDHIDTDLTLNPDGTIEP